MHAPKIPSSFIFSMSASGYSLACSRSRTTGRTSLSTNVATVSTTACSMSLKSCIVTSTNYARLDGDANRRAIANLYYRSLHVHRPVLAGETLSTHTTVLGLKDARPKDGEHRGRVWLGMETRS